MIPKSLEEAIDAAPDGWILRIYSPEKNLVRYIRRSDAEGLLSEDGKTAIGSNGWESILYRQGRWLWVEYKSPPPDAQHAVNLLILKFGNEADREP